MKNTLSLLIAALFFLSFITISNQLNNYKVNEDFSLIIKGDSNVHKWESSIEYLTGFASVSFSEAGDLQIDECNIVIPTKSIKSSKGNRMDKNTYKALKESEFPNIQYSLTSFGDLAKTGNKFTAKTTGNLTVAGTTKLIAMDINGVQLENGNIEITGSKDMKITDFDIKPPTALLGTMRTKDEITIEFRVVLDNEQAEFNQPEK